MDTNTATAVEAMIEDLAAPAATARLTRLTEQREQIEHDTYAAVLEARLAGVSWSKIGAALGVTAQAAHQRYHGERCNRPICDEHPSVD